LFPFVFTLQQTADNAELRRWAEQIIGLLCNLLSIVLAFSNYAFVARVSACFLGAAMVASVLNQFLPRRSTVQVGMIWVIGLAGLFFQLHGNSELPFVFRATLFLPVWAEGIISEWALATLKCRSMGIVGTQ
jgi:hypothetical protein